MKEPITVFNIPLPKNNKHNFHYMLFYFDSMTDIWESEMLLPIGGKFWHVNGIFEVNKYHFNDDGNIEIVDCTCLIEDTKLREILK